MTENDIIGVIIILVLIWMMFGAVLLDYITKRYFDHFCDIFNPFKIYDCIIVNVFGCIVFTILFNLLCPIVSIFYWICKFTHFIFTVGRKD